MKNKYSQKLTLLNETILDYKEKNLILRLFFRYIIGERPTIFKRISAYKDEKNELYLSLSLRKEMSYRKLRFDVLIRLKSGEKVIIPASQISWTPIRALSSCRGSLFLPIKHSKISMIQIIEDQPHTMLTSSISQFRK